MRPGYVKSRAIAEQEAIPRLLGASSVRGVAVMVRDLSSRGVWPCPVACASAGEITFVVLPGGAVSVRVVFSLYYLHPDE